MVAPCARVFAGIEFLISSFRSSRSQEAHSVYVDDNLSLSTNGGQSGIGLPHFMTSRKERRALRRGVGLSSAAFVTVRAYVSVHWPHAAPFRSSDSPHVGQCRV